jgi:hypothetical protein
MRFGASSHNPFLLRGNKKEEIKFAGLKINHVKKILTKSGSRGVSS